MENREVVVIGAGPAGVQCAVLLARFGLDVAVFDPDGFDACGKARWRDPASIALRLAREYAASASGLGVSLHGQAVERIARGTGSQGFVLTFGDGRLCAGKLVLAFGMSAAWRGRGASGPDLDALELDRDNDGLIEVGAGFSTAHSGVFAVGDCVSGYDKSVSTALGSGAAAAREIASAAWQARGRAA